MQIVIDASIDLSSSYLEKVEIIPLYIIDDTKRIKISKEFDPINGFYQNIELYNKWINGKLKTSQPSLKDVIDTYKKIDDKEILVITISSKLSGAYNVAKAATKFIRDRHILVYDSKLASAGAGLLVEILLDKLERETLTLLEAYDFLQTISIHVWFTSNIDFLLRSGRINKIKYGFLKILNGAPMLKIQDGEIIFDKITSNPLSDLKKKAEEAKRILWAADYYNYSIIPEPRVLVNPVVAINIGPAFGLASFK